MKVIKTENEFCIAFENGHVSESLPRFYSHQEAVEWLMLITEKLLLAAIEFKKSTEETDKKTGSSQTKPTLKPKWSFK